MPHERATAVLQSGIAAARAGSKARARAAFREAVALDPHSEIAWLWLAGVTDDPAEGITYLERVLRINPEHERARAGIEYFRAKLPTPQWYCPICEGRAKEKFVNCPTCGSVLDLARADHALTNPKVDRDRVQAGAARLAADAAAQPTFVVHYYLGMALLNLGKPDEALPQFRAAQRLKPVDPILAAQVVQLEAVLAEAAAPAHRPADPPPPPVPADGARTVLVVDDSPTLRRMVGLTLQKNGYRALEAADATEAFEQVQAHGPPAVVLLDVTLPGPDGYSVLKRLRAEPATERTPVILLGKDGFLDRMRGRVVGSDKYLTKPVRPDALVRVVREYCPAGASHG
jgi:twitching motility two-component system response regulator PilG